MFDTLPLELLEKILFYIDEKHLWPLRHINHFVKDGTENILKVQYAHLYKALLIKIEITHYFIQLEKGSANLYTTILTKQKAENLISEFVTDKFHQLNENYQLRNSNQHDSRINLSINSSILMISKMLNKINLVNKKLVNMNQLPLRPQLTDLLIFSPMQPSFKFDHWIFKYCIIAMSLEKVSFKSAVLCKTELYINFLELKKLKQAHVDDIITSSFPDEKQKIDFFNRLVKQKNNSSPTHKGVKRKFPVDETGLYDEMNQSRLNSRRKW
jgi:hypothetical protein